MSYDWLYDVLEKVEHKVGRGVSTETLRRLRRKFRIPPSFVDFLRNWDGIKSVGGRTLNLLPAGAVLAWDKAHREDDYYVELPRECVVVAEVPLEATCSASILANASTVSCRCCFLTLSPPRRFSAPFPASKRWF
jgi:hypothetical protein